MNTKQPPLGVIVLAAGKGTRMKSALPKTLHPVCGKAMARHVIDAATGLSPTRIVVVVGHGAEQARETLRGPGILFVEQPELLGTADAVRRCHETLSGCDRVLVLNGDSPLIRVETLQPLVEAFDGTAPLALLFNRVPDEGAFGRIQRDGRGQVAGIVEASSGGGGITERNAGQYMFEAAWLWTHLERVTASDSGEYYLTSLPGMAHAEGRPAQAIETTSEDVMGVDTRAGLAAAEAIMRQRILARHLDRGVTISDPATTYIDADVVIEADVTILPNCYLYGATYVAGDSVIGPGTTLENATVGSDSRVKSSVIEDSRIGDGVQVGPFSHVRGGAEIGDGCFLGNYAEVKNARLGAGVKMHHFSYIGDAEVGERTNIAAGTITCNYDGVSKHRTVIGRDVLLGSDTMLVAPVTIGDGAMTAAGSVVTRDLAPGERVAGVPARTLKKREGSE